MKILCVCRSGRLRSVEMKNQLNKRGYNDVIAVGGLLVSQITMNMLCEWADTILLAKPEHGAIIADNYRVKINKDFYVGDDMEETVRKALDKVRL